jgi:hypothetical protein
LDLSRCTRRAARLRRAALARQFSVNRWADASGPRLTTATDARRLGTMTNFEEDLDLQENDSDEDASFPPAERKVVTQAYDLSIQTLSEQWANGLLILPEIQREYVWDDVRASRLLESVMLNIPIPVLYLAENEEARYEIIDGHQRIRSIVRFLNNEFVLTGIKVLSEYRRRRFHELPEREQRFLKMRTLRAIIIAFESHPTMKFEIFERLNSGSIALNAQELRNSMYRGTLNRLLHELVTNPTFRRIVGGRTPRKRMVDEELLLRFFALHSGLEGYRPPLKRFLNEFMMSMRNADAAKLDFFRNLFERTIDRVHELIGDNAFRLTDVDGNALEKPVNRALFDSQMLAMSWVGEPQTGTRAEVLRELATLYHDAMFLDAIRRATGDRSRTRRRVNDMVQALARAGCRMDVPFALGE